MFLNRNSCLKSGVRESKIFWEHFNNAIEINIENAIGELLLFELCTCFSVKIYRNILIFVLNSLKLVCRCRIMKNEIKIKEIQLNCCIFHLFFRFNRFWWFFSYISFFFNILDSLYIQKHEFISKIIFFNVSQFYTCVWLLFEVFKQKMSTN